MENGSDWTQIQQQMGTTESESQQLKTGLKLIHQVKLSKKSNELLHDKIRK